MRFFEELKRRNVIRVAALYVVASWLILQAGDLIFDAFDVCASRLIVRFDFIGLFRTDG